MAHFLYSPLNWSRKMGNPVGGRDLTEFTQPDSCESPLGLVLGSPLPAVRE